MYHASNSRNLSLPTFLLISLHLDIIPKSTAIYLVLLIRLSSTSADKLLVKSHPHWPIQLMRIQDLSFCQLP